MLGLGVLTVGLAIVLVVVLSSPALPVAVVGGAAVGIRLARKKDHPRHVAEVLGVPVLVGLFGVAVSLGTLGRAWSGPATLLSHLGSWGTASFAALSSVVVNNLPAASLLSARTPQAPSLFARRAEPRAKPVRDRVTGLVVVVANGSIGSGTAVDCQSEPHRRCRGAAVDGRRSHLAGCHRLKLTTRSSQAPNKSFI